jgi:ribonuclease BN (tRNA processing enzyme)
MTESRLERSARFIDGAVYEGPESINHVDRSFHEIADGVGLVCGFSHIWTLDSGEGLVVVDTSQPDFASAAVERLRRWRNVPVDTVVYTHGHVDHVSGAPVFRDDAVERGRRSPGHVDHVSGAPVFRDDNAGNPQKTQRYPAEWAAQAAPTDKEVRAARAEVYRIRRGSELSLMARNVFHEAHYASKARLGPEHAPD